MVIDTGGKVPGPELEAYRDLYGISRKDLAERMGKHRNTLLAWESIGSRVDLVRASQYRRAVDEMVLERTA